jgi:hypothetical protein
MWPPMRRPGPTTALDGNLDNRAHPPLQAVEDRERGVDPRPFTGCVVVEHQAADDGEGQGCLGLGGDVVGGRGSQQLGELGEPVMDAGTAETREPVGLGLSERVDLVEQPEQGAVGRVGNDCAERADEAAEIPRALFGELRPAGIEELAASLSERGGDQRVPGSEVVDEHPGAGIERVREISQGDLRALAGDEQVGRLLEEELPTPFVARSTRCCNVVTGIGD